MFIGAINGSDLINQPWSTITSPFTNLLGTGFYLIPVSFIALALYVKTRNIVVVSAFIIASGSLLGSVGMFSVYPEMSYVYWIFTGLGIVALVLGLIFSIRR
jgi:fucose 4-O-acetylase-like acetyltransferase